MKIFLMKINVNACTLENSSHIFSSYNVPILIFQKLINKYIPRVLTKRYILLNSKNVAQNFVRLTRHLIPATLCFNEREIFSAQCT